MGLVVGVICGSSGWRMLGVVVFLLLVLLLVMVVVLVVLLVMVGCWGSEGSGISGYMSLASWFDFF